MTKIPFSQLSLTPKIEKAISKMGFDLATPIQSEAIPLIRKGVDVIALSQTGTGKTIAFAVPAIEKVDTEEEKSTVQVLLLCPTRELAQQAAEEIRKVSCYNPDIHPVEVYGGAAIDKQCIRLRRANIVIGTPGRVMDHMRRKTLKLSNVKMVILDEADEMLNMGFKEDIETILKSAPEDRQTVLFSATMPPSILKLTQEFQKNPQLIEIDKEHVTIDSIEQCFYDVPHSRKKEALVSLLQFFEPKRTIIFCNTKKMVDELAELLVGLNFTAESIHSDIKQAQRTAVMKDFKQGRNSILIATDIAARGIDVNDVDFVINFDIPMNSEYYVHRIGRTGRAGKSGRSITLCSGRQESIAMRKIAQDVKSSIVRAELPTSYEMDRQNRARSLSVMEEALQVNIDAVYSDLAAQLMAQGHSMQDIAAAALQLHFKKSLPPRELSDSVKQKEGAVSTEAKESAGRQKKPTKFDLMLLNIGSEHRAAVNHIIGAITERTSLVGSDIGKVEVFSDQSVVQIPYGRYEEIEEDMVGCKINGRPVKIEKLVQSDRSRRRTATGTKKAK